MSKLGRRLVALLLFGVVLTVPQATAASATAAGAAGSGSTARGDFNGDGRSDLAVYQYVSSSHVQVYTYTSLAGGGFAAPVLRWEAAYFGSGVKWLLPGDYNRDGKDDIALFYDHGNGHVAVWAMMANANGDSGFGPMTSRWDDSDFGTGVRFAAAGDFDDDGWSDIALLFYHGGSAISVWTITGSGDGGLGDLRQRFSAPAWGSATQHMAAGDFDGDGRDDLVFLYRMNGQAMRMLTLSATGGGAFAAQAVVRWDDGDWGHANQFLSIGDFNDDSRDDVAIFFDFGGTSKAIYTFTSSGGGAFAEPVERWKNLTWGTATRFMFAGDFNDDGKDDLGLFYDYGYTHLAAFHLMANGNGDSGFASPEKRWQGTIPAPKNPTTGTVIANVQSGKCATIQAAGTADAALVVQYECFNGTHQRWQARPLAGGVFQFVPEHTAKCLEVDKGSTEDTAKVLLVTCNNTATHQQWTVKAVSGTTAFQMVAKHSGKCLAIADGTSADNSALVQRPCGAGTNERWFVAPAKAVTPPRVPVESTPTIGFQASAESTGQYGKLYFSYVDAIGKLWVGYGDPNALHNVQWTAISGNEAFTGRPAIAEQADGRVQIAVHNTDSDTWLATQNTREQNGFGWFDSGGSARTHPGLARDDSGRLVAFSIDASGGLWHLPQSADGKSSPVFGWRPIGGSGMTGTPIVVPGRDGFQIFGMTAEGAVKAVTYHSGSAALSGWQELGGSGLTGLVAVNSPGYVVRLFAKRSDGVVVTKAQTADGTFPAQWEAIGDFVAKGMLVAILDPRVGRFVVAARGADDNVFVAWESSQGSGVFKDWELGDPNNPVPAVTELSTVPMTSVSGDTWLIVYRDRDGRHIVMERVRAPQVKRG